MQAITQSVPRQSYADTLRPKSCDIAHLWRGFFGYIKISVKQHPITAKNDTPSARRLFFASVLEPLHRACFIIA